MNRNRLFMLASLAAGTWLIFAVLAVTVLSPATRLLTAALLTGALLVVGLYEVNKRDRNWKQAILFLFMTWLVCDVTLYATRVIAPKEAPKGALVAAIEASPATACNGAKMPSGSLLMIMGRSGAIGQGAGPFTPFRVSSCPALSVTRTAQGLMVNAFGYDSDNNVVYRIRDNVFDQVVGGFLTEHRPDRSTLVIGDDHGPQVLEIRYLNRNAVQILGTFRCGDSKPVHIAADGIFVGTTRPDHNRCITLDDGVSQGLVFSAPPATGVR